MDFEIIDFHVHPFITPDENVCRFPSSDMDKDFTLNIMKRNGVSKFCGSVISRKPSTIETVWEKFSVCNEHALELFDYYNGSYVAGCLVHPCNVDGSKKYIDLFSGKGLNLVGEIVPWSSHMQNSYNSAEMLEILDYASTKGMILSAHPTSPDDMDLLCENLPNLTIVGAHPGEGEQLERHILRAKKYKNYYLDLSGTGIFRYRTTRKIVDEIGAEKVIFGTDYPICSLQIYIDGVMRDELLSDDEKRLILSGNAKRLLKL